MTPNRLAGIIVIALALGIFFAWFITRRMMARPPVAGTGIVILAVWTLLAGGLPYGIFVIGATSARRQGTLGGIASLVVGLLPLMLIAAPIVGFAFTLKHFSRHIHTHFSGGEHDATMPTPEQDSANGVRNRDPRDPGAALDRAEDQDNT